MQYDLYGNPILIRKKDEAGPRQYVFPPEVITMVNTIHLITGKSKTDIVCDGIRISALLMKCLREEDVNRILEKDEIFKILKDEDI